MPEKRLPIKFQSPTTQPSAPDAAPETATSEHPMQRLQGTASTTKTEENRMLFASVRCPLLDTLHRQPAGDGTATTDVKQPRSKPDRPAHRSTSPTLQPMHAHAINGEPLCSQKQTLFWIKSTVDLWIRDFFLSLQA
jgi:hypothetical protein